jgi:proteasome accessory factor A
MALSERIFSLETEYGVQFYADESSRHSPSETQQVFALVDTIAQDYGLQPNAYLLNGSKFHHDVGHPEWSLPECHSAREAASYDKAADHLLRAAIPEAERRLAREGFKGHLFIFKNNVDSSGKTFGCHENYMMKKDAAVLGGEPFRRYMVRYLVPFLVTRQLFCGAGRLDFTDNQEPLFRLSQRAEFIEVVVSDDTTGNRAIVNWGREKEPLASSEFRRLHLIIGDSNMSGWSTWFKLGVTGLLLRLIEDLYVMDVPLLADPVAALRQVASDPRCSQTILLRDGRKMTAPEIQWQYYDAVCDYVEKFGSSSEEDEILDEWEQALLDIESDPEKLRNRVDWAIKKMLFDSTLKQVNGSWDGWKADPKSINALKRLDISFHDVSERGEFSKLWNDDTLVSEEEIQEAQLEPPQFTRANIRGKMIARGRKGASTVRLDNWPDMIIDDRKIEISDPLQFAHPLIAETYDETELENALRHEDAEIRIRASTYFGWEPTEKALRALARAAANDADERVRRTALDSISKLEIEGKMSVLIDCLRSDVASVRWAAEEAITQTGSAQPRTTGKVNPPSRTNRDDDDGELLVNIIS